MIKGKIQSIAANESWLNFALAYSGAACEGGLAGEGAVPVVLLDQTAVGSCPARLQDPYPRL